MIAIGSSGCAALLNLGQDKISVVSIPDGAEVSVDGVSLGTTPLTKRIRRKYTPSEFMIDFSGQFYSVEVSTSFNIVSLLNSGNFVGWLLDGASASLADYNPEIVAIVLPSANRYEAIEFERYWEGQNRDLRRQNIVSVLAISAGLIGGGLASYGIYRSMIGSDDVDFEWKVVGGLIAAAGGLSIVVTIPISTIAIWQFANPRVKVYHPPPYRQGLSGE